MAREDCPTKFLKDSPASADAFGPHERIADELADLIKGGEAAATVALEGGWGSGKSTVVTLLNEKLRSSSDLICVTVFDAWAHQGDPLRRTFLETLISSIGPWLTDRTKEDKLEELSGRTTRTVKRETPKLSEWAKKFAVSLLFVPLGAALASMSLFADSPVGARLPIFFIGAGFGLAPLAVLIWRWKTAKPGQEKDDDIWAPFTNRVRIETHSETIETPNPTSVEFERIFSELISEALANDERRLVLVLDNLDRVRSEDALEIWSTMQTFLHRDEHSDHDWLDQVWVLIPYDPEEIRHLWEAPAAKSVLIGSEDGPVESDNKAAPRDSLASSFLDKTFRTRYAVPPPLLSDWYKYLLDLLKETLPAHKDEEFHTVYRVFQLARTMQDGLPTPRTLKLFVNQLAAVHRLRDCDFPVGHMAYFVALQRQRTDIRGSLVEGELPPRPILRLLGENIRESLAALHFGTDSNRARQLLLGNPISEALAAGDGARLKELATNNPGSFWPVLEELVANDEFGWSDQEQLAIAAATLRASGLMEQDIPQARTVHEALAEALEAVASWSPFTVEVAQGVVALGALLDESNFSIQQILRATGASPLSLEPDETSVVPEEWAKAAGELLGGLSDLGLLSQELEPVVVPGGAPEWVAFSSAFAQIDRAGVYSRRIRPAAPAEEIVAAFNEVIVSGGYSDEQARAVELTMATLEKGALVGLGAPLQQRLTAQADAQPDEVQRLAVTMWKLAHHDSDSVGPRLTSLAKEGHFLHHLNRSEGNSETTALCIFLHLRVVPRAEPIGAVAGQSEAGQNRLTQLISQGETSVDLVRALAELLTTLGARYWIFQALKALPSSRPLMIPCLKLVIADDRVPYMFDVNSLAERWSVLEEELDAEEMSSLVQRLLNSDRFAAGILGSGFDVAMAHLYATFVRIGVDSYERFSSWYREGINGVNQEDWEREFIEEGPLVGLLLELIDRGEQLSLDLAYPDALAAHAKRLIDGPPPAGAFRDRWGELLHPLSTASRTTLRRKLVDLMAESDGAITEEFLALYGGEVGDGKFLKQQRDAPYRLFSPILQSRNEPGLAWIRDLIASDPIIMESFADDTVEDFKKRIRQEISKDDLGDDAAAELIREIAKQLNVHRSPRQKDELEGE